MANGSEDFDLEAKVVEKTKEEEMMENQNGLGSLAPNNEQEAILATANSEEAQTDERSEIAEGVAKENVTMENVENDFNFSAELEGLLKARQHADDYIQEENKNSENLNINPIELSEIEAVTAQAKREKRNAMIAEANLVWENPIGVRDSFQPKTNTNKNLLLKTDPTIDMQYLKVNINTINPASYKKVNLSEEAEEGFLSSVIESGQIVPIGLVKSKNYKFDYDVLFGKKRVNALAQKGEDMVLAIEYKHEDEDSIKLVEINEALIKVDLPYSEKLKLVAQKRKIYEKRYPDATPEQQRKKGLNVSNEMISRLDKSKVFTKELSEIMSVSQRSLQMDNQIKEKITAENHKLIEGSILENKKVELLSIARLKDPVLQEKVIKTVLGNKAKNVKEALSLLAEELMTRPRTNIPLDKTIQLSFDLQSAKSSIRTLEKEKKELSKKVKELEKEVQFLKKQKAPVIPEFTIYPYTDLNKEVIQEEGGQNE